MNLIRSYQGAVWTWDLRWRNSKGKRRLKWP